MLVAEGDAKRKLLVNGAPSVASLAVHSSRIDSPAAINRIWEAGGEATLLLSFETKVFPPSYQHASYLYKDFIENALVASPRVASRCLQAAGGRADSRGLRFSLSRESDCCRSVGEKLGSTVRWGVTFEFPKLDTFGTTCDQSSEMGMIECFVP